MRSPTVTGGPHLMPIVLAADGVERIVVVNAGVDPAQPVIHLPRASAELKATLLRPLAEPEVVPVEMESSPAGATVHCPRAVPHYGYLVVEVSE